MPEVEVRDLRVGDVIKGDGPTHWFRVKSKEKSKLFSAPGGCFRFDFVALDGDLKGQTVKDQHYPGCMVVETRT